MGETVWFTQNLMAELFHTSMLNINMHLKSIFEEGEVEEKATIKDFLIVQNKGLISWHCHKIRKLDMSIAKNYLTKE